MSKTNGGSEIVTYEVDHHELRIALDQFDQIRQATIEYIMKFKPEFKEVFVPEIGKGTSVINADGQWQHGAWRLEEREGRLVFIRYPDRSEIMYFFIAFPEKKSGHWVVTSLTVERMRAM